MSDLPAIKYLDKAARAAGYADWGDAKNDASGTAIDSIIAHARTLEVLAKYEPEPVDTDRAVVDRILNAYWSRPLDSPWDGNPGHAPAIAQYKAEHPTITDDEALLIAREICAKVAKELRVHGEGELYYGGSYDNDPEVQFALAMVKRDPAALEAFRGVVRA